MANRSAQANAASPLSSMTGFARAEGEAGAWRWSWEVKSVNSRGLDIRCRLAGGFDALDGAARRMAGEMFARGAFQVSLQIARSDLSEGLAVDEDALAGVIQATEKLRSRFPDAPPPRLENLLALKGVLKIVEAEETGQAKAARDDRLEQTLRAAFTELDAMRAAEGTRLAPVLRGMLDRIEDLTAQARRSSAAQPEAAKARLARLVDELLGAASGFDPARLAQEAALLVAKSDIREELDRLQTHVEAARELVTQGGACGRRLDFLTQEMNREANTLGAKSPDIELKTLGLELKSVIDQLKEQVQNIE